MAGKSNYLETQMLNWIKGTAFPTTLANTYVALFTTNPDDSGTGAVEPSTNAYARVAIASSGWSAITGGTTVPEQISNSALVQFPTPTSTGWGSIVGIGLYSAATGTTNLLYWQSISSTAIGGGANVQIAANGLVITDD